MLRFVVKGINDVLTTEKSSGDILVHLNSEKFISATLYGQDKTALINVNEIAAVVDFEPPAAQETIQAEASKDESTEITGEAV